MTMTTDINHVLTRCFNSLRQIRSIKRSLPSHALDTPVTSFVHSRLDYCNVVFAGLPARDLQRLQSVRLVSNLSSRCHVTHPCYRIVIGCPSDSVCSIQAVQAGPPLLVWKGTILSRRARHPDPHRIKQQSWSEGGTVAVHHFATYSLNTRRPRVLRRSASSLEQPSIAHKTYLLHGHLLKELEIFPVFMCILTVVFLSVLYVLCFHCLVWRPCYILSHHGALILT